MYIILKYIILINTYIVAGCTSDDVKKFFNHNGLMRVQVGFGWVWSQILKFWHPNICVCRKIFRNFNWFFVNFTFNGMFLMSILSIFDKFILPEKKHSEGWGTKRLKNFKKILKIFSKKCWLGVLRSGILTLQSFERDFISIQKHCKSTLTTAYL